LKEDGAESAGTKARDGSGRVAEADGCTIAPLSFAQEGLWFLDQIDPGRPVYNVPQVWDLVGPLDVVALHRSLQGIVDRHAALRTTFGAADGRPYQRIHGAMKLDMPIVDLGDVDASSRDAEALRHACEEARRPFDLSAEPPFRARLLRLHAERHWLVVVFHHIARDGGSMAILRRDVSAAYNAFRAGKEPHLALLPVEYADYIVWQREQLSGDRLQVLLEYWRGRLRDAPAELTLPTDRRRPVVRSMAGASELFWVDADLVQALRALGREEGATLHMTLLSAFQLLLSRYSDQDDILVGAPVAGRVRPEFEGVIGYFSNMVVHRADLGGNPSFRELLRRTRQSAVDAYAHQDLPLDRLVEALAPVRDRSRNPLFQVIFTLQDAFNVLAGPLPLDGVESNPVDVGTGTSKVDLSIFLVRAESGLRGAIEYSTDLFDASTIRRMIASFLTLLAGAVADPDRPASRLAVLDPAERRRILVDWNATRSPYPSDVPLSALFAATARRAPDAIAVIDGARALSYAELDRRSRRLAYRLRDMRLGAGERVGVCIERSIEEVVALLGVLKAGCVCVPLDPMHPVERLATVLADAGAAAVVTAGAVARTLEAWPAIRARPIIVLDATEPEGFDGRPDPPLDFGGDALAEIIYTSGSTGSPKGVAIAHRAIARLVCGTDYVQLGAGDVVAHASNPAFDAATFEIFGALLNGSRLVVIPRETILSPREFAAALERAEVTTLFVTTALFNQMAREAPAAFRACRQVLFGGEAAEPRWAKAVLEAGGPERLLNIYGPTEATTFTTWHEVRAVDADASTIPIGRPIANTEVYILDRHGEPVPVGSPGEIFIGGPGVAAGYFGRPDLTAERFVPHPFDAASGACLYRTGDSARFRSDGAIEFLGRFDRQVKIRGHRIEPDEVEAALLRLAEVREAAVLSQGSTSDTRKLTAYVSLVPGAQLTPADIGRELRRSMPAYMVPARIFIVTALPLTSNGKIDRHALPDPDNIAEQRVTQRMHPRDPLEHTLAQIWEDLLGTSDFGIQDSFFDVGGHSLLAAQLVDAVERTCGYALPLTTLFTDSTIEQLAQVLRRGALGRSAPVVALNAAGTRPPFFFLHGDFTGGGFYAWQLARALGPDQPVYAVHPHGLGDSAVPESIEAMAADRIAALQIMRPEGPYFLGGHCNGALVAVEMAQQLARAGCEIPVVVVLDAMAPWQTRQVWPPVAAGEVPETPSPHMVEPAGTLAAAAGNVFAHYRRAMRKYEPARYSGRIVVLRSENTRDLRRSLGWSMVSDAVETYDIPGDHHTSITRHIAATAARISACLEEASRGYALP
jgi:amino acid adenylation domain-containing protein